MKTCIAILTLLLLWSIPALAATGDTVVLLHGMGRTKASMEKMAESLTERGYAAVNIDYASRKKSIEELVEDVEAEIKQHAPDPEKKIHFVGYSMGGLVIRAYLTKHRPRNLGRVVMLGTPNQGSEVADLLSGNSFYKSYFGPAGQELVTHQKKFEKIFGTVDYDLGVIAGDRTIDPVSTLLILPGTDDGKVSVERSKVKGMKDHIVLHTTHTFMPRNAEVIRQTARFLEQGLFDSPAK